MMMTTTKSYLPAYLASGVFLCAFRLCFRTRPSKAWRFGLGWLFAFDLDTCLLFKHS